LKSVVVEPDFFIDDTSHNSELTIKTFEIVWPLLKSGSFYCIEDTHTNYYRNEEYVGGHLDYFRGLVDSLMSDASGVPSIGIDFIAFHKQIVFIKKK